MYNATILMTDCNLTVNTSSTLIALFGRIHMYQLQVTWLRVNITGFCAVRGCVPLLVMFGGARPQDIFNPGPNITDAGLHGVNVAVKFCNVDWRIVPPLWAIDMSSQPWSSATLNGRFPINGTSFGAGSSLVGIISISLYYDTNVTVAPSASITGANATVSDCTVTFLIDGGSAAMEAASLIDEFAVGVVVVSGRSVQSNFTLRDSFISVSTMSVAIRSSGSSVVYVTAFKGGTYNISIDVSEITSCYLNTTVKASENTSSVQVSIVQLSPTTAYDSRVTLSNIRQARLHAVSGDVGAPSGTVLVVVVAAAVVFESASASAFVVSNVSITASFGNGTIVALAAAPLLSIGLMSFQSTLVFSNDLYEMGAGVVLHVASSSLYFAALETTVTVSSGIIIAEAAAIKLSSCPTGVTVISTSSNVTVNEGAMMFVFEQKTRCEYCC